MRIQPRRFSESPNQNTRGTWCVSAVLLRYVSAIRAWGTPVGHWFLNFTHVWVSSGDTGLQVWLVLGDGRGCSEGGSSMAK